jgi:hypothetical protein
MNIIYLDITESNEKKREGERKGKKKKKLEREREGGVVKF